jgi:hypothetical protein
MGEKRKVGDDHSLIEAAQKGDEAAFCLLPSG